MHYIETKEKAGEFSRAALARLESEGLIPHPYNYELLYAYYAGSNTDVVRAIDVMIAAKQEITDERCAELHHRFLSDTRDGEAVREAGQRIQNTIEDVSGRMSGVKSAASEYGEALSQATQSLTANSDPEEVRRTLDSVLNNTNDMLEYNKALEEELEKSASMMQELQRDLEAVQKQAFTDGLTNLANRKAFDDEIVRAIEKANSDGLTFALVLMDIDHFKSFNDNYGHQVGDQVLRLVAKTFIDGVKGRDFSARYGGEEFALILPETDLNGGTKVADSLRRVVQGKELANRNTGDVLGRITLSGGVAEYVPGEGAADIIQRADAALYAAKHNGRNQITAAPNSSAK